MTATANDLGVPLELLVITTAARRGLVVSLLEEGLDRRCRIRAVADIGEAPAAPPPDCVVLDAPAGAAFADVRAAALSVLQRSEGPLVVIATCGRADCRALMRAGVQDVVSSELAGSETLARAVAHAVERWRLARDLKVSEARFRTLASAVPHPLWLCDASGQLVFVNDAWREYFGTEASLFTLEELPHLVHPDDLGDVAARVAEGLPRSAPTELECRLRRRDGAFRWQRVTTVPLSCADGQPTHWYGVNTDTHEATESAARLRLALEASKTGIWTWSPQTDAVTWTPECYEIMGMGPADFEGTGAAFFGRVHPDDVGAVKASVEGALRDRATYHSEFRVRRPDGVDVWVENVGRASYDRSGNAVTLLGTVTDISLRKRIELEGAAARRSLQSLADNLPAIVARFDADLRHVFIGGRVEQITGRPQASFLGKTNRELGMPDDLCDQWDAATRRTLELGGPISKEFDFVTPRGLRHFLSVLVREEAPGGPYVLAVTHDVTDIKTVEQRVLAQERELQQLADSMPQLVWRARADGLVDYYNARVAQYAGAERRPEGTWSWQGLVHPDDVQRTADAWRSALAERGPYSCEHRIHMLDGSWRWHLSRAEPMTNAAGEHVWYGTATDIHEQKTMAERVGAMLRDAELAVRARNQVLSVVSHDLKTPLATVALALTSLRRALERGGPNLNERVSSTIERALSQSMRMGKLIDELVDTAWLQSGSTLALKKQPFDLVALARSVVDEADRASGQHAFELVAPKEAVIGQWDPERIERVIANLVDNARKYSPQGGRITVEIAVESDAAVLRVIDSGIGIAPADQERIFNWFSRAATAVGLKIRGTGIGLASVKRIVEQHGGSIGVRSVVGAGSTFELRLPRAREP